MAKQKQQPRIVAPELEAPQQKDKRYKSPLALENEFLNTRRLSPKTELKQMSLFEAYSEEYEVTDSSSQVMYGLGDLSTPQLRAISAIQIRLEDTKFKGDVIITDEMESNFSVGKLPILRFTITEFLDLSGAERGNSGKYTTTDREALLEALESFTQHFYFLYERKYTPQKKKGAKKDPEQRIQMIRFNEPLLKIRSVYDDITEEEAARAREYKKIPGKRLKYILIEPSGIFLEGIANRSIEDYDFYVLKPVELYREIAGYKKAIGKKGGVAPSELRFISWLLTKNLQPIPVSLEKLAEGIGLYNYIETRQEKRLKNQIAGYIEMAKELGFILDYHIENWPKTTGYIFTINPDRSGRPLKANKSWKRGDKLPEPEEES